MLGILLWPLIRSRCLIHDKYYRPPDVHTVALCDPKSHFGGISPPCLPRSIALEFPGRCSAAALRQKAK